MKRLLLLLLLSPLSLFAQSGTLNSTHWKPSNHTLTCAPEIEQIDLAYRIKSDSLELHFQFDLTVACGNTAFVGGKSYAYPTITSRDLAIFQLSTLQTTAELYAGSSCLGKIELDWNPSTIGRGWEQSIRYKRNWSSFGGCRAGNLSLRNLKIKSVDFDGEREFKNRLSELLAKDAAALTAKGDWQEGLEAYKEAKAIADPYAKIHTAICDLERKIKQYDDLIEKGDRALKTNKFLEAKSIYEKVEKDLIIRPYTQVRIKEIKFRIEEYELKYHFAEQALAQAKDAVSLKFAQRKFEDALQILPVDKKSEIDSEVRKITYRLEQIYSRYIGQADLAFRQKQFVEAAKLFIEASKVYDRKYPKEKLEACKKGKKQQLLAIYQPKLAFAKKQKLAAANEACLAIDANSESCFLTCYEEQKCQENYYKTLIANSQQEANALILQDRYYNKPTLNCGSSTCTKAPKNQYTAPIFLAAAKRKHQLARRYSISGLSKYRDEYLDQAINLNPSFIEAYLFKAKISSSKVDKIVLYKKVLEIDQHHSEALQEHEKWTNNLKTSIFQLIDRHNFDEIRKAMQLGMLKESFQKNQRNLVQYVIDQDKAEFLELFFMHPTQLSPTIPWDAQVLLWESIEQESVDCAKLLLANHWADPNKILAQQNPFLLQAIEKQNLNLVKLLLSFDAVPNSTNKMGNSALFTAVSRDQDDIAVHLLEKLSAKTIDQTSIFLAVKKSKTRLVKTLLQKGVHVDLADQKHKTLLHLAIEAKSLDLTSLLLAHHADLTKQDMQGNIPLLTAAKQNSLKICQRLLKYNMEIDLPNFQHETALYWAAKHNMQPIIKHLLLKKADVDVVISLAKQRNNQTCLDQLSLGMAHLGIKLGKENFVIKSVEISPIIGWDTDAATGLSLLELAAKEQQNELFFMLANLDQTEPNKHGQSLLHFAINQDNKLIVRSLLSGSHKTVTRTFTIDKAQILTQLPHPLHYAIRKNSQGVIPEIIQFIDINQQDDRGWTALHEAIAQSNSSIIKQLIAQGANPKIKNKEGLNAKRFAKSQNKKFLIKALKT